MTICRDAPTVENRERQQPSIPTGSAGYHGHADEPAYAGFHTYAASDLHDTGGGGQRWPENWGHTHDSGQHLDDDDEPGKQDYGAVLLWTVGWYSVPAIFLILRALLAGGRNGHRTAALADLLANSPIWLAAMTCGLGLAFILRWASDTWRAVTIGFCAAVVSGGAMTVLTRIW